MALHNITGRLGEAAAVEFLRASGYTVRDINWRTDKAEVDIIAEKNNLLVFVEVKTRSSDLFGSPAEAVGLKKQRLLIAAAEAYLEEKGLDREVRFDILSITHDNPAPRIEHIEDAFSGHM
jgi:putative endonuclease